MIHTWVIPGEPVAQGRPRLTTFRGHARAYDPAKSRDWKSYAVGIIRQDEQRPALIDEPVALLVTAVFGRPQRLRKKKFSTDRIPHGSKPDCDNIFKAVADSLERAGVLRNDSRIYDGRCCKAYAANGEAPHVEIVLRTDEQP